MTMLAMFKKSPNSKMHTVLRFHTNDKDTAYYCLDNWMDAYRLDKVYELYVGDQKDFPEELNFSG